MMRVYDGEQHRDAEYARATIMARKSPKPTPPSFLQDAIAGIEGQTAPTPSTLDILAAQAAAAPADDTLQLVYADCLDEHDKAVEAATIRAAVSIRQAARAKMAALQSAAAEARAANVAAYRALALEGVAQDDPAYPVCLLLARSITVGRESDGYPTVNIPDPVKAMLRQARNAGMIRCEAGYIYCGKIKMHSDASGLVGEYPAQAADYQAWREADRYHDDNKAVL